MNLLLRSILATAMLIPFDAVVEEAEAAGARTCNQYVAATRSLAARAKAAKCDFWGGGFDEAASRRWCNGVKEQTIRDATPADAKKVGLCEECRGFSNRANAQVREANAFRCNTSGPMWELGDGGPADRHFQLCLSIGRASTTSSGVPYMDAKLNPAGRDLRLVGEQLDREAALRTCRASWSERFSDSEKAYCEKYALDALEAALVNQKNNCGATPVGRWTLDKEPHLVWCIQRVNRPTERADIDAENGARYDGMEACKAGGKLKPNGDVLWKGPPIRTLGKRPPRLQPDQVNIDPEPGMRPKKGDSGTVKKNPGSGGISTSTSNGAMDRLGGGGNVPNIARPPKTGSGGPSLAAPSGGNTPGAGNTIPTTTAPAVTAAPIKSLGKSGPDNNIDFGGRPPPSTGTKIR